MSTPRRSRCLLVALVAGAVALAACQEVEQPSPTLTEKQWNEVQEHIYKPDEAPTPEYKIGANFEDKIELVGFSVGEPDEKDEALVAGEKTTFRWYWKVKDKIDKNWEIFVHFDSKNTDVSPAERRQNLDHEPLGGLFPTGKWSRAVGKIVEDVQEVTIREDYPAGPAVPYIGFYRGQRRLAIKNDVPKTDDRRVKAPSLNVTNDSEQAPSGQTPSHTVRNVDTEQAEAIEIDGDLDEDLWGEVESIELSPFGSTPKLATEVDVFRTDSHLFVGAEMEDSHVWSTKSERDANTWEEEVLELFVDPDGDGADYLELQINPKGTIFDAHFETRLGDGEGSREAQIDRAKEFTLEGLESAVSVDGTLNDDSDEDEGWSVELKIPVDSLPGLEEADAAFETPWAVNLYRYDRPDDETTHTYAWSTAARGDFHQVDKFGRFEFGDASGQEGDERTIDKKALEQIQQKNRPSPGAVKKLDPNLRKKLKKKSEEANE